MYYIYINKKQ